MPNTKREFFAISKNGTKFLGQDLDGQGLSANKELANYHGLPIHVKIGDKTVRHIMPDWDSVDHTAWPDHIPMPEQAKQWARQQAAEYFAAHQQPCSCSHCAEHVGNTAAQGARQ